MTLSGILSFRSAPDLRVQYGGKSKKIPRRKSKLCSNPNPVYETQSLPELVTNTSMNTARNDMNTSRDSNNNSYPSDDTYV